MSYVFAGVMVATTAYSGYESSRQMKSAKSSAKKSRAQQREQMNTEKARYDAEVTRQTEYEARAFESATGDYERTTANLEAWKENWSAMAEDPRGQHPGWPEFESAVTKAAEGEMKKVQDIYQRRGKAESGEYLRAVQDIESGRQKSLQDTMMGITREARGKMFEIDLAMPKAPVLGVPQTPGMYSPTNYGFTPSPLGATGDMSGLGAGLAYAVQRISDKRDRKPEAGTLPEGSQWGQVASKAEYDQILEEQFGSQQTKFGLLG